MGSKTHTTTEKLWDELQNASQYNLICFMNIK